MPDNEQPMVSHGRGGQGNIGHDTTEYVDGEIVREGVYGDQGDGAYSAGRGGAGNIGSPMRGGQGNVHLDEATLKEKEEHKKKKGHEGLADKLKNKLLGRK
ncbi:hypothetical protein N7541_005110 [Penicillium brevicompactum]|uniref:Uncharacterized protein n=1 Tax=Penicillium brevicompactum TaxID=5074 RepID=A0A9W9RCW6_PENBR|nr:hypothetical protein N7541_005110 [Penicillium brevicompactum]